MVSALSSAVQGIMSSMGRMDRAATTVARSGLPGSPVGTAVPAADAPAPDNACAADLPGAMVDILMAQRAFSAQLRVLRTSDEMSRETVDLIKR